MSVTGCCCVLNLMRLRRKRALRVVIVGLLAAYILFRIRVYLKERDFYELYLKYMILRPDREGCVVPRVDPYDPDVDQFIFRVPPLRCDGIQPYFTYVDYDGNLRFNDSEVRGGEEIECFYSEVWRINDNEVGYGKEMPLNITQKMPSEVVYVKCRSTKGFYENVHTYVKVDKPWKRDMIKTRTSVFILAVDSVSRANLERQLPKTLNFLTEKMDAVVFNAQNKVGHNTLPNVLALLTGLRFTYRADKHDYNVSYAETANTSMNTLPLVWNTFQERGYVTMFAEDMPKFAPFNYLSRGFDQPPVDHYMRPFWLASENCFNLLHRLYYLYCFGNKAKHNLVLDYTREFLVKYANKRPYFAFSFISEISHNYVNQVQVIDDDLVGFLKSMQQKKAFENAVVIVTSDHGIRYDKIRATVTGSLEDRLPFLSVVIPSRLQYLFPAMKDILLVNSERLTTWFDVHEMLKDIALDTFEPGVREPGLHGISLFREKAPANRTCEDAGIVDEYCTCIREQELPTSDAVVGELASTLVTFMNFQLGPLAKYCATLTLKEVNKATVVLPNKSVASQRGLTLSFRVTVTVSPSGGKVEALLRRDAFGNTDYISDLIRVDRYGNQSDCITHRVLRSICYCRKYL